MLFDETKKNVLLLEDLEGIRLDLERDLKSLGYIPHSASSRQEFLQICGRTPAYAFILDNNVPYDIGGEINPDVGLGLARNFLRREPDIKVALHTESEMNSDIEECVKGGLVYIHKPASVENLKNFLEG